MNNFVENVDIVRYQKAFSEVYEILKYLPNDLVDKISSSFLNLIKQNRCYYYNFAYDSSKKISEQNISKEAKSILSIIYRTYIKQ